jgi:hypothetical protein
MNKILTILLAISFTLQSKTINPEINIEGSFNLMYTGKQQFYYVDHIEFDGNMARPKTVKHVPISDYTKLMPGYFIELKIGKISIVGIEANFEHNFAKIKDTIFIDNDSGLIEPHIYPVDLNMYHLFVGPYAVLLINKYLTFEPSINPSISIFNNHHKTRDFLYNDLYCGSTSFGISGIIKTIFMPTTNTDIEGLLRFTWWDEPYLSLEKYDFWLSSSLLHSFHKHIKGIINIGYYPFYSTIYLGVGVKFSIF